VYAIYCMEREIESFEAAEDPEAGCNKTIAKYLPQFMQRAHLLGEANQRKAVTEVRKITAKKGGDATARLWAPIAEEAHRLALAGNYKSRRHAAHAIAPKVIEFAKQNGLTMSSEQAPKTISETWLKARDFDPRAKRT
jgi:hypothetical protein